MFLSGIPIGNRPPDHETIMGNNQQPWFTSEAIDFLENKISKSQIGFEFGSGSSTFWFSKLTSKICSIESDVNWHNLVFSEIKKHDIKNIDLHCVECNMLQVWDEDTEKSGSYEKYSNKILEYDVEFDYVIVDGVARSLCILNSIKKIKPGGFLIIDNSERPAYWDAMSYIPSQWKVNVFKNKVDTTTIFQKDF
jgi:hypothetical protein